MAAEGDEEAAAQLNTLIPEEPPMLDGRWLWLWRAWEALQPSRPSLMTPMGILVPLPWPWVVIEEYGRATGCGEGERAMLHQVLRKLEGVQLKHDQAEARRRMEQSG